MLVENVVSLVYLVDQFPNQTQFNQDKCIHDFIVLETRQLVLIQDFLKNSITGNEKYALGITILCSLWCCKLEPERSWFELIDSSKNEM